MPSECRCWSSEESSCCAGSWERQERCSWLEEREGEEAERGWPGRPTVTSPGTLPVRLEDVLDAHSHL